MEVVGGTDTRDTSDQAPEVALQQLWRDKDRRYQDTPRIIRIIAIDGDSIVGRINGTDRETSVKLERMNRWQKIREADGHWLLPTEDVSKLAIDDEAALQRVPQADALEVYEGSFGPTKLVPLSDKFHTDEHGLTLNPQAGKPTLQEWGRDVGTALRVADGIQYIVGDLFNLGPLFGEEASQYMEGERYETAKNWAWVAKQVPIENRRLAPTWSHAQAVASLTVIQQRRMLTKAREEDWSVAKLKTEVAADKNGGKAALKHVLIVTCKTEAVMDKLADRLEGEGFSVLKRSGIKKEAPKPRKKGPVTAKGRRPSKMNQRRRPPR